MPKTIVMTGASSGFGESTAYQLADAGHTVHASMRGATTHNADKAETAKRASAEKGVDLRTIEVDVLWPMMKRASCVHSHTPTSATSSGSPIRLVRVLQECSPTFPGFFLYDAGRRQTPPALRALIDFLQLAKHDG